MSSEASLGILVDDIEAYAVLAHDQCSHASSDFDTVEWDITCLRYTLKEIKHELSRPDSNIKSAEQARQEALATIVKSYRPLLQQLHQFATKDQGLKKKWIWRSHKPNIAVLDRFHRELQFQTQTINLYLSTLAATAHNSPLSSRLAQITDRRDRPDGWAGQAHGPAQEGPATLQAFHQGSEADAQWSLLRLRLIEDGITDTDIEAHTSSIRALLQERLPTYYELPPGPGLPETDISCDRSAGSHENVPQKPSKLEYSALGAGERSDRFDHGQDTRFSASIPISAGITPVARNGSPNRLSLTRAVEPSLTRIRSNQPPLTLNKPEGMFYIHDSTDSESESLHFGKERHAPGPSSPRSTTKMITPEPPSSPSPIKHQSSACHEFISDRRSLEDHSTISAWSCAAITPDEAAFFDAPDSLSVSVCGLCGMWFHKSPDITQEKMHLINVHKWQSCTRDKLFYRAHHFRRHLKHTHHAIPGWWSLMLERRARRNVRQSRIPDASGHASSYRDSSRSRSRQQSSASHRDRSDPSNAEVVPRPSSSNFSRTGSMRRVHSDISEYDAQGNLLKRTITDSYTSIADTAAALMGRCCSSPGPDAREPLTATTVATSKEITQAELAPRPNQDQKNVARRCPFCSTSLKFYSHALMAHHMSVKHKDLVVQPIQALKHQKLKHAYKKLHSALQLLGQNEVNPPESVKEGGEITNQITQLLNELDDEFWPSSSGSSEESEGCEHAGIHDVDFSEDEKEELERFCGGPSSKVHKAHPWSQWMRT